MGKKSTRGKRFPVIDLRAIEEEVLAEGREWMRRRMEDKIREKAKSFSPGGGEEAPERTAAETDA